MSALEFISQRRIDRSGLISIKPKHGLLMKIYKQDAKFNNVGVGKVKGNINEMVELPRK